MTQPTTPQTAPTDTQPSRPGARLRRRVRVGWARLVRYPERGAGGESLELVIVAPVLIVVLLVCIALGRYSVGSSRVDQAATTAARAASLQHDPDTAATAAKDQAANTAADAGVTCRDLTVDVDTTGFTVPAGEPAAVTVTVTCTVDWSDLTLPGWPGTTTLTASASSPLDLTQERRG